MSKHVIKKLSADYYMGESYYKARYGLFIYSDGSNRLERRVYGPDGYYRPDLSWDEDNISDERIRELFD